MFNVIAAKQILRFVPRVHFHRQAVGLFRCKINSDGRLGMVSSEHNKGWASARSLVQCVGYFSVFFQSQQHEAEFLDSRLNNVFHCVPTIRRQERLGRHTNMELKKIFFFYNIICIIYIIILIKFLEAVQGEITNYTRALKKSRCLMTSLGDERIFQKPRGRAAFSSHEEVSNSD